MVICHMQVKVEKILADANGKMTDRLALACKKAAEMREAAESARSRQAASLSFQVFLPALLSGSSELIPHCNFYARLDQLLCNSIFFATSYHHHGDSRWNWT